MAKALNYTNTFESRDPRILAQYTAGQWFRPCFRLENIEMVPKFQISVATPEAVHMKRKGLIFAFSFSSPVYVLAGPHAMPVQMPDFAHNVRTLSARRLSVIRWDNIAALADKAYTHFTLGNTELFHRYMQAYNDACRSFAVLKNIDS